jgi:signal peptidase I
MIKRVKYSLKSFLKDLKSGLITFLIAILLAILMRVFLFASFKIPSPSMEPAVKAGDFIIVNKQIPGPRVYRNFKFKEGAKVETRRFKGIRKIRRNDVLVFNYPYTHWGKLEMDLGVNYLKRCVAIPGDTFYIENGFYKVKNVAEALGCLFRQEELAQKNQPDFEPVIWKCFPQDTAHNWNIKDFGPLYVPKAGDTLPIDTLNYRLYKNLIEYETDKPITLKDGAIYRGEEKINRYTFQQNYYFMAGDYLFDSKDSRYWGLLPEDHIIGKAIIVWKSIDKDTGKIRWERTFKTIN